MAMQKASNVREWLGEYLKASPELAFGWRGPGARATEGESA
jgi:hypothetical protein